MQTLHYKKVQSFLYEGNSQLLRKLRKFSTGFLRLKKFSSVCILTIRFICVQNVMYKLFFIRNLPQGVVLKVPYL